MKTVTISVTQKHIEEGIQQICNRCPIALAIRDLLPLHWPNDESVSVWGGAADLYPSKTRLLLPDAAIQFIEDFDIGEIVQPFSFELEVPQP